MNLVTQDNVTNVYNGTLPAAGVAGFEGSFRIAVPSLKGGDKASLYTKIEEDNISTVDLSGSNLNSFVQATKSPQFATDTKGEVSVSISDIAGISSAYFETYDAERYSVFYENGNVEDFNIRSSYF